MDRNNNGVVDATDTAIGFDLKGSATGTFITPLTTPLMAKKEKGGILHPQ